MGDASAVPHPRNRQSFACVAVSSITSRSLHALGLGAGEEALATKRRLWRWFPEQVEPLPGRQLVSLSTRVTHLGLCSFVRSIVLLSDLSATTRRSVGDPPSRVLSRRRPREVETTDRLSSDSSDSTTVDSATTARQRRAGHGKSSSEEGKMRLTMPRPTTLLRRMVRRRRQRSRRPLRGSLSTATSRPS